MGFFRQDFPFALFLVSSQNDMIFIVACLLSHGFSLGPAVPTCIPTLPPTFTLYISIHYYIYMDVCVVEESRDWRRDLCGSVCDKSLQVLSTTISLIDHSCQKCWHDMFLLMLFFLSFYSLSLSLRIPTCNLLSVIVSLPGRRRDERVSYVSFLYFMLTYSLSHCLFNTLHLNESCPEVRDGKETKRRELLRWYIYWRTWPSQLNHSFYQMYRSTTTFQYYLQHIRNSINMGKFINIENYSIYRSK